MLGSTAKLCIQEEEGVDLGVPGSSGAEIPGPQMGLLPGGVPGHSLLYQKQPKKGLLCSVVSLIPQCTVCSMDILAQVAFAPF